MIIGDSMYSCMFITTYYEGFLQSFYANRPYLAEESYNTQLAELCAAFFGDSDFYSEGIKQQGWAAKDIIINCSHLQKSWARENGFTGNAAEITIEQIRRQEPHVVYLHEMSIATRQFIKSIRPYTQLIVGQIASPVPSTADVTGFDIIFSSFPHFVERFRQAGVTSYYQPLAFEKRVLDKINGANRNYPVTFIGGISRLHGNSIDTLTKLAENVPIQFWGYGAASLPEDSPIRKSHNGIAWGMDMFSLLHQSRITVNRHIDVAENHANNMRLFEATGCGALLLTDYKDNLNDLFEIGKEVVAYRSPEECIAQINYYMANPDKAEKIARAGQERTLRDHAYSKRMTQTAEILERHLRYKKEKNAYPVPQQISDGLTLIKPSQISKEMTTGWQDASIPARQRGLVQKELAAMYMNKIPPVFHALATSLRQVAYPECSILEIGCASGYCYEILEYLLNQRVAYTGVDYSTALIAMAKDYYPGVGFHVADGADLPFPDEQFFIAISSCVLLHVPNYREHIRETARVAQSFVLAHRMPVHRNRKTQYMKKLAYGVETVQLFFNEEEIISEFEKNDLKLIKSVEFTANPAKDLFHCDYLFQKSTTGGKSLNPDSTEDNKKHQTPSLIEVNPPSFAKNRNVPQKNGSFPVLPDFLIIGAEKSASTYVHKCLIEHPEVYMPAGEIAFFEDPDYSPDKLPELSRLLEGGRTHKTIGIRRPDYLGRPECAARIHRHMPTAKLIVILRDPVDRAISAYYHNMKMGLSPVVGINEGLLAIIRGELQNEYPRTSQIIEFGLYYKHLSNYLKYFDKDQILIMLHEDIQKNPLRSLKQIFSYLNIKEDFVAPSLNSRPQSGVYSLHRLKLLNLINDLIYDYDDNRMRLYPKKIIDPQDNEFVKAILGFDRKYMSTQFASHKPELQEFLMSVLSDTYHDDVSNLAKLTGFNLNHWKVFQNRSSENIHINQAC